MPVTSEATFMNSPLIINVEGGGLAFDLARHRGALYLAWRRKLLLIYETCCLSVLLLLAAYLVLPITRKSVGQLFQGHVCHKSMQLTIFIKRLYVVFILTS